MPLFKKIFPLAAIILFSAVCFPSHAQEISVDRLRLEGIQAYQNSDAAGAIEKFTSLLRVDPRNSSARYYLNLLANDRQVSSATRIKLLILGDLLARMDHLQIGADIVSGSRGKPTFTGNVNLQGFINDLEDEVAAIQAQMEPADLKKFEVVQSQPIPVEVVVPAPTPSIQVQDDGPLLLTEPTPPQSTVNQELAELHREVSDLQSALELNKNLLGEKQGMIDSLRKDIDELRDLVSAQQKEFTAYLDSKEQELEEVKGILEIYKGKLADTTRQLRSQQTGKKAQPDLEALSKQLFIINQFLANRLNVVTREE